MNFATLLDRRAAADPDGLAIADSRESLTNRDMRDRVHAVETQLDGLGVGRGDVIAVALANRIEFVLVLFAAWRRGAAVTPVNPASTPREAERQIADSEAKVVVLEDDAVAVSSTVVTVRVSEFNYSITAQPPDLDQDDSALALLIYTSGTTGSPKGVMLDHANLGAMTEMCRAGLDIDESDRCLLVLPLFHVNGIVVSILTPMSAGASVLIAARFDPRRFFADVAEHRPTYFSGVPTIFSMLASIPDSEHPDTSSIRFAVCGAAPAPAELLDRFRGRFGFPVVEGYGLSEGTCATTLNPIDGVRKAGTVGPALPGQEIRIVDRTGAQLPVGEAGEVIVRGPNVMRGYFGRPEETARTVVDGWLHTGDVGRVDTDGYLTLVGRSKELIIRGGENIYPKEIEDVLTLDSAVMAAAVLGAPDARWGEVVVAFVEPKPGADVDIDALEALCRNNLTRFKQPSVIHVVAGLPRNAVGKIDKKALAST
ncbi:MAG: AMP-binding protein [Rhodococcus sp. (in: high G+C Gram-positive bacteria)]|uniref:class I adenylate-forming enzyme family protein n=1 Tax=Rhodococcus sp. TaxID=1831 RepID=UPI002AD8455B|nr:AMP-binding protein [Rhodococcus sp. (in: high G+C Gram-positive bacteria)]